eukprot:2899620-Rhodomonas_salina.1
MVPENTEARNEEEGGGQGREKAGIAHAREREKEREKREAVGCFQRGRQQREKAEGTTERRRGTHE